MGGLYALPDPLKFANSDQPIAWVDILPLGDDGLSAGFLVDVLWTLAVEQ